MNGFASAILSILLGWLRALFDNLWRVLSSESGGTFLSFLRFHWKTIFAVLCVGGFLVDRIIFFFRWRPDYVWSTRLNRLKRRLSGEKPSPGRAPAYERRAPAPRMTRRDGYASYQEPLPEPQETYEPPQEAYAQPAAYAQMPYEAPASGVEGGFAPLAASFQENPASPWAQDFAPMAGSGPDYSYPTPSFADVQPVFDDPTEVWTPVVPELPVDSYQRPYEHPATDLAYGFGSPKPEPEAYLRDVQAGFAPPPAPEELYPKREPLPGNEPVHPGLDLQTFQQNIGLGGPQEPSQAGEGPLMKPLVNFPDTSYVSYYREAEPANPAPAKGGLASLAKKARELVRMGDEENQPTIRDLQSTASIKTAFHSPVLPKKPGEGDEE